MCSHGTGTQTNPPLFVCIPFQLVRYPYICLHANAHNCRCHIDIYLFCIAVFPIALGNLPQLAQFKECGPRSVWFYYNTSLPAPDDCVTISTGLSPVPAKWNLAFAGQASASHCRHCFCLAHTTDQCDWAPDSQPLMSPHMTSYQYLWHPTSIRSSSDYLHYARPGTMTHTHIAPFPTALIGIFVGIVSVIPTKASTALVLAAPLMLNLYLDSNTNDKPLFR